MSFRNVKSIFNRRFSTETSLIVKNVYQKWLEIFETAKISEPNESIQNILNHVLNSKKIIINSTKKQLSELEKCCKLRLKNMPLQYIIGEWPFQNLNLKLKPPVFIPRPETEHLVSIVLQHIQNPKNILEICCGSGAICLALMKAYPKVKTIAIDRSSEACELTKLNATYNNINLDHLEIRNVELTNDSILFPEDQKFDLIISNPPYIPSKDLPNLQKEILLYEDIRALDGGIKGLDVIIPILKLSVRHLVSNGCLFLEVDPSHPPLIEKSLPACLKYVITIKDLYNKDRFILVKKI